MNAINQSKQKPICIRKQKNKSTPIINVGKPLNRDKKNPRDGKYSTNTKTKVQ